MFFRLANPNRFFKIARVVQPIAVVLALVSFTYGLYQALYVSPADYQQGETVRIMYIHVPAAWLAVAIYISMAVAAFFGLIWRHVLADLYCRAAAPLGLMMTALCLITGSLWGKPMWGTYWVWDARLTSVFVLLLLYAGYIALARAYAQPWQGERAGAWLLLVGVINIPIIRFSVDWWSTLHQPASVIRAGGPTIDPAMLQPLMIMGVAYFAGFVALVLPRLAAAWAERRALLKDIKVLV